MDLTGIQIVLHDPGGILFEIDNGNLQQVTEHDCGCDTTCLNCRNFGDVLILEMLFEILASSIISCAST